MCTECGHIHGHAGQCPNNPAEYEPEMVVCEICGEEVPDEDCVSGVCPACIAKATTYENAMSYGADRKTAVVINGYLAYEFSAGDIAEILERELALCRLTGCAEYHGYLTDDSSDFADWLKAQKNID
jgi:predicted amidophosphoribosyltransferase